MRINLKENRIRMPCARIVTCKQSNIQMDSLCQMETFIHVIWGLEKNQFFSLKIQSAFIFNLPHWDGQHKWVISQIGGEVNGIATETSQQYCAVQANT